MNKTNNFIYTLMFLFKELKMEYNSKIIVSLNEAANYFNCPIEYIDERPGDIKHIIQSPDMAFNILGWKSLMKLEDGINDVL